MEVLINLDCTSNKTAKELISPFIIRPLMAQLPDWKLIVDNDEEHLKAEFKIQNYMSAIAFCNAIAELAESVDHHPKIIIEYAKVTVFWWTHTLRGLHKNDFILAAKTSALLK
ncbi:MAG: 4a-hydroxytetrahydrobiopterin dehydratase [Oceanospirillaceae bacterium]|jgi:4a-hydroxytetrahydrobiopterin dehydratase